jgi:hypothetical protein
MDEASKGKPQASTFLAAGLLGLIRVDGFVLGAVLCLLALLLHRDKWRVILYSPLILVLPASHIVFRMVYYGYPMPNTYYLKITAWRSRWLFGVRHVAKFLPFIALLWIVATVGVVASHDRRARALWLLGLPLLVYTIYVGGDDFSRLRFLSPWMPILYVLAFLTPHWLGWEYRHPRVSSLLLILLFLLMAATNGYLPFSSATSTEEPWVRTGLLIRNITEPDTSIGVFPAGTLPYFAERPSVDMLGKNDYVVARRAAFPGANRPGHNKFDYEYSLNQHQPDLLMVLFPPSQIIEPGALDRLASGDLAFGGQLYLNDTFQADYASNLAFIDTIPFFIRKDSGLQDQLMSEPCEPVTREALLRLNFQTVCWPEFEHNLRE